MRDTPILDVTTRDPVTVAPETPILEAMRRMVDAAVSSLPVVDGDGRFLGFLGDEDVVIEYARLPEPRFFEVLGGIIELPGTVRRFNDSARKLAAASVADAMDPEPQTVGPEATVEDAATLMVFKGHHRLAVVDHDRRLLGIVSRSDLVRMIQAEMR